MLLITVALSSCRYANNASDTLFNETKASTVVMRYEWFKEAYEVINAKKADIEVQKAVIETMDKRYAGISPQEWLRSDADAYNLAVQTLAGIKMSYNTLVAEYNANMKKTNYAFCKPNDGTSESLPQLLITE